jgi:Ion channel
MRPSSDTRQYLLSLYYIVSTCASVGYGDIGPTDPAEIIFSLFLIVVGTFVYTIIVGMLVRLISQGDNYTKTKIYEVLGELYQNNLIQKSLLLEISDHIEASIHNPTKIKYTENSEFIDDFTGTEQLFVTCSHADHHQDVQRLHPEELFLLWHASFDYIFCIEALDCHPFSVWRVFV